MNNEIVNKDSLEFLKNINDFDFDIIYCDPPYALGSEIIINSDGKVDYKNAVDFMNKWDMPTGKWWENWFNEAYRILKYGGYCIMFGIDRQLLLFKYYAHLSGFQECQSLYWYYITSFPKSTDLSKMIDKNAGVEREIIEENPNKKGRKYDNKHSFGSTILTDDGKNRGVYLTKPKLDLAKKYNGYRYSIAPFKQTNETIMIFQKPYKTNSCLYDTLEFENGNGECCCGALNIEKCKVPTNASDEKNINRKINRNIRNVNDGWGMNNTKMDNPIVLNENGRYPAQTFIDTEISKILDKQSGINTSCKSKNFHKKYGDKFNFGGGWSNSNNQYDDTGGCSKILHKCDFENGEYDLYIYCPKVNNKERNAGINKYDEYQYRGNGFSNKISNTHLPRGNDHPTLKPISLSEKILKLFKTPNEQKICYPFAGAGSEIIGGIKAGFSNWIACEINNRYIEIAKQRIKYWINNKFF